MRPEPSRAPCRAASSTNPVPAVNFVASASRQRLTTRKQRVDIALCERGLAATRAKAQSLVRAGRVLADGAPIAKASLLIDRGTRLEIVPGDDFVSRGGHKLHRALDDLGIDLKDKVVVDVGASTGGFTDAALRRGARRVYAVDVGRDQLDRALRDDPRVVVRDGTNARTLAATDFTEPIDVVLVTPRSSRSTSSPRRSHGCSLRVHGWSLSSNPSSKRAAMRRAGAVA